MVERLVRNESGRNSPTQSQPLISILPVVKAQLRVYLTLSETFSKIFAGGQSGGQKRDSADEATDVQPSDQIPQATFF
ncbi:MAG TPA: hypothetical protein VKE29_01655, partial [Candidatus Udaeobacter sp.]|nr:hypothetical protein [Candidatus Udaeobacter sp.]